MMLTDVSIDRLYVFGSTVPGFRGGFYLLAGKVTGLKLTIDATWKAQPTAPYCAYCGKFDLFSPQ